MFREQFSVNQAQPLISFDLFNVKQRQGESLKNYLNRFWAFIVKLQTHDEPLMVNAFGQGVMTGSFSDSLIRNPTVTFVEIQRRVVAHINAEEAVYVKHKNTYPGQTKPKKGRRSRPLMANKATTKKRTDARRAPYPARKNMPKAKAWEDLTFRPKFRMTYKDLLKIVWLRANKMTFLS